MSTTHESRRLILRHMLSQAIEAVDPAKLVRDLIRPSAASPHVAAIPVGASICAPLTGLQPVAFGNLTVYPEEIRKIIVLGTGKASASMAAGLEAALAGLGESGQNLLSKLSGMVNVPDGTGAATKKIEIMQVRPQGKNAVTDRVLEATRHQVELLNSLGRSDILIDLISGGGSATRELFCEGVTLQALGEVVVTLQSAGATIQELNAVRKQCSQVKGGKMNTLAKRARHVLAWVLSDVVGDPLDFIASGPWAENTSSPVDALRVLQKYGVRSGIVYEHVFKLTQQRWKAILPGKQVQQVVIGNNYIALCSLAAQFTQASFIPRIFGSENVGNAHMIGAGLLQRPDVPGVVEIWGGETTVTLPVQRDPSFKGGRNQTIVLSALAAAWVNGLGNKCIFSIGTDGEDGPSDAAGAMIDQEILDQAKAMGITLANVWQAIDDGNEYPLLDRIGALIKTGPTGTNVCDLWGVINYQ